MSSSQLPSRLLFLNSSWAENSGATKKKKKERKKMLEPQLVGSVEGRLRGILNPQPFMSRVFVSREGPRQWEMSIAFCREMRPMG